VKTMTRAIGWVLGLLLVLAAPALAYDVGDAVDFSGTDEAGRARALDDYAGKTVVLVFWGSDDPASRAYAERLTALARRSGGDVVVLGVATTGGDDRASVQRAKREQGLPFPILVDPEGEIAADFGARVLTTACVIGPDGKLRYSSGPRRTSSGTGSGPIRPQVKPFR